MARETNMDLSVMGRFCDPVAMGDMMTNGAMEMSNWPPGARLVKQKHYIRWVTANVMCFHYED